MSRIKAVFPDVAGQRGLATVAQLIEAGWTASALRHARATAWQEPKPRVVTPHRGPLDADTRLVAAGLWASTDAVLTGSVALNRLGLQTGPLREATVVIPEKGRARRHGQTRTVRSTRAPEVAARVGPVTVAAAARAVTDAAVYEQRGAHDLEHLTISVLQRGLTTPAALESELWERPRARVAPVWKGLDGFAGGGAWSRPEVTLRAEIEGAGGFPPLLTNCRLVSTTDGTVIGVPDGYIEEAGVAIQVHSRQHHQGLDDEGGDRWARTVERDGALCGRWRAAHRRVAMDALHAAPAVPSAAEQGGPGGAERSATGGPGGAARLRTPDMTGRQTLGPAEL